MRLFIPLLLIACSGPGATPTKPTGPQGSSPGLLWATESAPYHLPHSTMASAADGDTLFVAGSGGWVSQLDLKTGKVLKSKKIAVNTTFYDIAMLSKGKLLAVGTGPTLPGLAISGVVAYTFDSNLDGVKEVKLSGVPKNQGYAVPKIGVLSDGGVVITGRGLPLAIYDPITWVTRSILDPQIGWSRVFVRGDILVVERGGATRRYDMSTNGQHDLQRGWTHLAIGDAMTAMRVMRAGKYVATIYPESGTEVTLTEPIDALAFDGSGKRLLTIVKGELRVHSTPHGDIIKRIPIKDAGALTQLYAFGSRVVVHTFGVMRVIDLDAGTVMPPDVGTGTLVGLAVGNDGRVLSIGNAATSYVGGKVTGTAEPLGEETLEVVRPDDPLHYVSAKMEALTFHAIGDPKQTRKWTLPDTSAMTWMTRDGSLLLDMTDDGHKLMRTKGTELVKLFDYNPDANLLDAEPEGDALVALEGRVRVATLDGKPRGMLTVPQCENVLPYGKVEAGGTRAATWTATDMALWDRNAGKLLASTHFTSEPERVMFIPKRPELVLLFDDNVILWTPGKGTRTLPIKNADQAAVSSDGKRMSLGFHDGHVALFDLDAVLAAPLGANLPEGKDIKPTCDSETDPLELPKEDFEDGVEGGEEGGDPCGD